MMNPTAHSAIAHELDYDVIKTELLAVGDFSTCGAHKRIREILTEAGFEVRALQKIWVHDIWEVRLLRSKAVLPETPKRMEREFARIFQAGGIPLSKDEVTVSPQGRRINLAFTWSEGEIGILAVGKAGDVLLQFRHGGDPDLEPEPEEEW